MVETEEAGQPSLGDGWQSTNNDNITNDGNRRYARVRGVKIRCTEECIQSPRQRTVSQRSELPGVLTGTEIKHCAKTEGRELIAISPPCCRQPVAPPARLALM